jgi:DNA repair protein RecN (Recombination protein N)
MLSSLQIKNFTIVKQLELDFSLGMIAFTGETGAGKSIMIDALMLALGHRADSSVVRLGEEKCDITAIFQVKSLSEPVLWLAQQDIECSGEIVLRRVLYTEGRSKSYINGHSFPLQKLKELSAMLVHIHGQHQQQTLMQHATHRQHVDNYANAHALVARVYAVFKQRQIIAQELEQLQNHTNNQAQLSLLQFQINELEALCLQDGEMKELSDEHQLLHHANDYLQHTQYITQLLNADENPNVNQQLHQIIHALSQLPQTHVSIKNATDLINNALIQCQEAFDEIEQFAEQVQLDPERLQFVEKRLSNLLSTARKYHIDADKLPIYAESLKQEWQRLQKIDEHIATLKQQLMTITNTYYEVATELSNVRRHHAVTLAQEITAIIQRLGMPHGYVTVNISSLDKIQPHGIDKIEYYVCTNPGTNPSSLNNIVSGGELSRISLAIQMITAQRGATPTLFFDEVDVGIGGATAALVGQLLRKLGEHLQIFCVTHQAQVASSAHHHFIVTKYSNDNQTYSQIFLLKSSEKVTEIARMLGGLTITKQTRLHAQELLNQSC